MVIHNTFRAEWTIDDWEEILAWLDGRYDARPDAAKHREKLVEEAEERDPRSAKYPR